MTDSSTSSTLKPLLHPSMMVPPLPSRYVASRQWTHPPISASFTHRPQLSPPSHGSSSNTIVGNDDGDERRKRHGNVQRSPLANVAHTDRSHVRHLYSLESKRQLPSLRVRGWSEMRCHDQLAPSLCSSPPSRCPPSTTPFSPLSHPTSPSTFPPSSKRSARVREAFLSPRFHSAVHADLSHRERKPYRGGIGAITPLQRPSPRSHPRGSSINSQASLVSSPSSVSSLAQIRNPPHHHLHPSPPPPISSPRIMRIKGLKPGYASSSP